MDKDKLVELAERCEAATGPDDATDWAIAEAVCCAPGLPYTSSLDAAMTLVLEGWRTDLSFASGNSRAVLGKANVLPLIIAEAATPALALCAAALRSHAPK